MKKNLTLIAKKLIPTFAGIVLIVGLLLSSCMKEDSVAPASFSQLSAQNESTDLARISSIIYPATPNIPADALIYISYDGCRGCAAYNVIVQHGGNVTFIGIRNVSTETKKFKITPQQTRDLTALLENNGFYQLKDYYPCIADAPINVTALQVNRNSLKVVIDGGIRVPDWLGRTRAQILAILGIDKILNGGFEDAQVNTSN
jgi:hypothetical protein